MSVPPLRIRLFFFLAPVLLAGCFGPAVPGPTEKPPADPIAALLNPSAPAPDGRLETVGYTIQVGAFSELDNAVRLEARLQKRGIDAYYFRHESGLYKVRFGDHADYRAARAEAEHLRARGLIDTFFIVIPEDHPAVRLARGRQGQLRTALVRTARRFLGVPYRWGGTDPEEGLDCSGLTMVSYRLNGLNLPRVSRNQYRAGHAVAKSDLKRGDLVFFATKGGTRVTHVGMYVGEGRFIHAPRTGKTVRIANLSNPFFARTYVGGRSYL
jgi:hypothetical protein